MKYTAIFRSDKIRSAPLLRAALRHNKRENKMELSHQPQIDQARTYMNFSLGGASTTEMVLDQMNQQLKTAGVRKLRRDAVRGIELLFSLPANHGRDEHEFFGACVAWSAERFGGTQNILSADVHLDEGNPHCHVLILPLVEGRMNGSKLYGHEPVLAARLTSFFDQVGSRFGLERSEPALKGEKKVELARRVLAAMSDDPSRLSPLWECISASIKAAPEPFAALLKLNRPKTTRTKKMRTSAQIFTSAGRGPKSHEDELRRSRKSELQKKSACPARWVGSRAA